MGRARRRKQDRPTPAVATEGKRVERSGAPRFSLTSLLMPAAIVALGAVAFANSFSIPFLFDDHFAIVANPEVKRLAPVSEYLTQTRGLPALLTALNYRAGELEVRGYHVVNFSLHVLNALLVWVVARRTLRLPALSGRYDRHAAALALVTALVFLLHPLQTMVASYIVQRAESVAAFFVLLGVWAYLRGAQATDPTRRLLCYGAVVLAGYLGAISKETAVVLPVLLLVYHLVLRPGSAAGESGAPGWLLAAALSLPVIFVFYLSWSAIFPAAAGEGQRAWLYIPTAGLGMEGITPWRYLITQFGVIVWYLRLFVLPTRLCFDYGWPFQDSFWSVGVLAPLTTLLVLAGAALWSRRRYPLALLAFAWFLVTLAPSSSVLPIRDAAFEYRMYLPLFGLALLSVVGGYDLCVWLSRRGTLPRGVGGSVAAGAAALWIALLGAATVQRNFVLQDEYRLFADAAEKAPWNWRNHATLGNAQLSRKLPDEAMASFEKAVELNPEAGTPRIPLGDLYAKRGRLEEAETVLLPATDVAEESVAAAAYRQLGDIYRAMNYPAAAVMMYREAVARQPRWAPVRIQLAQLLRHEGNWKGAATELTRAATSDPRYAKSRAAELAETSYLGALEAHESGEDGLAVMLLEGVRRYRSPYPEADHYLAYLYARRADNERALRLMESVARSQPSAPLVAENLERARQGEALVAPQTLSAALSAR